MEEKRKALYDALAGEYNLGTYEEFTDKINNEDKRRALYDAVKDDYNLGTYEEYSGKLGFPQAAQQVDNPFPTFDDKPNDPIAPQEPRRGFVAGVQEGGKGLAAGTAYAAGEAVNAITGSSRDDAKALYELNRMVREGRNPEVETAGAWSDFGRELRTGALELLPWWMGKKFKEEIRDKANQQKILNEIGDVLEEAGGDVAKARRILTDRANDPTMGDRWQGWAEEKFADINPTEGVGAWIGQNAVQMIPSASALIVGALTKSPQAAQVIGRIGMGTMVGATAGSSMYEAREAGADDLTVRKTGVVDGMIEAITEDIPFNRYTKKYLGAAKQTASKQFMDAIGTEGSLGRNQMEKLLVEANERLGGKLFSKKNIKEYMADIAAEGMSEFSAEALQTMTTMIYEKPEDFSIIGEALNNGLQGFMAGVFMGSVLGGASKTMEHYNNRDRRKEQGFVEVGLVDFGEENGGAMPVEVLAEDREAGIASVLKDGEVVEVSTDAIKPEYRYKFSFNEFENARLEQLEDDAIDNETVTEGQAKAAGDRVAVTAAEMERVFAENGYDKSSIRSLFLGAKEYEYIFFESEQQTRAYNDYIDALTREKEVKSTLYVQQQKEKAAIRENIEKQVGGRFWQEETESYDENVGATIATPAMVETGTLQDGTIVYITSPANESGERAGITENGEKKIIKNDMLREGTQIMPLDEYIDARYHESRTAAEQARMAEETEQRINDVRSTVQQGTRINVGTVESPAWGVVNAPPTNDGAVVLMEDGGARLLSWDDIANIQKRNPVLTDAELASRESAEILGAEAALKEEKAQIPQQAEEASEETAVALEEAKIAEPLPMNEDGTVNEESLWNNDPSRWAEWNDEQRQDNGANSAIAVNAAIANLSGQIAEQQNAYAAMPVGSERNAVEADISEKRKRLEQLVSLQQRYAAQEEVVQNVAETQPEATVPMNEEEEMQAEEQRREPLRKRAQELSEKLGVKVNIAEDLADVKESVAREQILRVDLAGGSQRVTGWYNPDTNEVTIYLPHVAGVDEINATYIHEVVSHRGLKELLGEEGFNVLCDSVWDMMSESQKARFIAYPGVNGDHRKAADEFIAHLSETLNLEESRSLWDRIVAAVEKILLSMGVKLKMSHADLSNLLAASYRRLADNAGKTMTEEQAVDQEAEEPAVEEQPEAAVSEVETSASALESRGLGVDTQNDDVRYSIRYTPTDAQREAIIDGIVAVTGRDRATAERWLASETSLAAMVGDNMQYLDYQVDSKYKAIKDNSDYPQGTVDFNNICRKRLPFTKMFTRLQRRYPGRVFTADELADIRNIMSGDGLTVACGLCYVEDRRQMVGEVADQFITELQNGFSNYASGNATKRKNADKFLSLIGEDGYIPSIYELTTQEGGDKLYNEHRGVWEAFQAFNNARGQQSQNLLQGYAEYKREILSWSDKKVKSVNDNGGLRVFSYSDFEAHHLLDIIQIIIDCASKGVKIQGYTKVPAFARAVANTGIKLNRSLIPLGDTGIVDGQLAFDPVEGIDINDPDFLESNDNVGNILIGINDVQIRMAMADPRIHYIIPYHARQKENIRKKLNVGEWVNYISTQNERNLSDGKRVKDNINIYTDVLGEDVTNDRQFVEKYLQLCREMGRIPKFDQFLNRDAEGNYAYTPGYYKFLVDFKLFDENGDILPQKPVVAEFDDAFNMQILEDYVKGEQEATGDQMNETYDKIVETLGLDESSAEGKDIRFSVKEENPYDLIEAAKEAVARQRDVRFRTMSDDDYAMAQRIISNLAGDTYFRRLEGEYELGKLAGNYAELADIIMAIDANRDYTPVGTALLGFFAENPDMHFPLLFNDSKLGKETAKAFTDELSKVDDPFALYFIKDAWRIHKGSLAQAGLGVKPSSTTKFNKAIDARAEEIRAAEVKGTAFNFKKQESSLDEIDAIFKQLNKDENLALLHDRVMNVARTLGVKVSFAGKRGNTAGESLGDKVSYDYKYFNTPAVADQKKCQTIVHELIHSITTYAIYLEAKAPSMLTDGMLEAVGILRDVYNQIARDPAFKGEYGVTDVYEMVAELSNAQFRDKLKEKNLFQRILDALKRLLGIDTVKEDSAYQVLSDTLDYIIDNYDQAAFDAYALYASKSRSYGRMMKIEEAPRFRITPEQDKAYMDAVEAGDMETAQGMVDEAAKAAGYTIRGDHGRVSKFTIFDRNKANPEGNWGQGFYFSNNEEDVESNYATVEGPDLEAKIEREVERRVNLAEMNEEFNEDGEVDEFAIREEVENEFITSEPNVVHAAIKMNNPFVVGHGMVEIGEDGLGQYDMQETYLTAEYETDEDGEIDYDFEPTGTLVDLVEALNEELSEYEWVNVNAYDILANNLDGMTAGQFEKEARELLSPYIDSLVNDNGEIMSSEIIRAAIERAGFDGIVDNTVNQKFGTARRYGRSMDGMDADTRHYIAFQSSQIKVTDPVTYDNDGNVIPLSERFNEENPDIRFRSVWHGSGAEFSEFDHSFMGEGEGLQAYGWGTYVTESEQVGRGYAKRSARTDYRKWLKPMAQTVIGFYDDYNADPDFDDMSPEQKLADAKYWASDNYPEYFSGLKYDSDKKRAYDLIMAAKSREELKELQSQYMPDAKWLYSVEIPDDDGTNYLRWDKDVPQKQRERIAKGLRESGKIKTAERFLSYKHNKGEDVYHRLERYFGSDKEASLFLAENGFVGVSMPVNYRAGGNDKGLMNYVIFIEDDAQIQSSVRFRVRGEDESATDFHKSVLDHYMTEHKVIVPTTAVDVNDRKAVAEALGYAEEEFSDEMYQQIVDGVNDGGEALYDEDKKRIAIFAVEDALRSADVEENIFHENVHALIAKHSELLDLGQWMWDNANGGVLKKCKDEILSQNYAESKQSNEMLSRFTGVILAAGRAGDVARMLPEDQKKHWELLLNELGYEPERNDGDRRLRFKSDSRRAGVLRDKAQQEVSDNGASERTGLSAEERRVINELFPGTFESPIERAGSEEVRYRINSDSETGIESLVERTFRVSGAFSFSGKGKIESRDDVAFIFKQLEDSAIENSFLVFVKNGIPTVIHVGMGDISSTMIDNSVVLPAYKDFGADKIYMVHNHPSGSLYASKADLESLDIISMQIPDIPVEGIIINTVSGEYASFDSTNSTQSLIPADGGTVPVKVLSFDKNVFAPDYKSKINERRIKGSGDVASFLSAHRLGEGTKVGALLLNRQNMIYGNLVTNDNEVSVKNAETLASQIAEAANRTGSSSVILFGDFDYSDRAIRSLSKGIKKASGNSVSLLDVVRLEGNHTLSMVDDTLPSRSTLSDGIRFRTREEAQELLNLMQDNAETLTPRQLTEDIWKEEIEEKTFSSPIGTVRLGRNQFDKNINKGRAREFGMLVPTIEKPDLIFEESAPEEGAERQTKYVFVKTFIDENGEKHINYASISVRKKGMEVVESSHRLRDRQVLNKIEKEQMLWNRFASDSTSSAPGGSTDQSNALSDSKDTDNLENINDSEENISYRIIGTPTDKVVADGLELTTAQTAELAGNIFSALPEDTRRQITEDLPNILDLQDAIMQIPARLAMKEEWNDEDKAVAEIIARELEKVIDTEMTRPLSVSEALWMLYDSMNRETDLISQAQKSIVQRNLGFDSQTQKSIDDAKDEVRFRAVGNASDNAKASLYNKGAVNVWTRLKESFVDMNASVEKLVKAIEKTSGKVAEGFENVLLALNQQASKGLDAMERYERKFLNPMLDEIRRIMAATDFKYEDIVRHVILKHGLERNEKMAQRDAKAHYQAIYDEIISKIRSMDDRQKRTYLTNAQLKDADAKAALATLQAVDTRPMDTDQLKEHKRKLAKAHAAVKEAAEHLERAKKITSMSEQEALDELDKIFKSIENGTNSVYQELRKNDYSGLTSMFYDQLDVNRKDYETEEEYQSALMLAKNDKYSTLADVEAAAESEVTAFEGLVNTAELWKRINAATKETLKQQYNSNMISKDQYESLRDMFEFYVPLRGFKDNTAEDMYTYYRKPNSTGYTKPILGAEGRKTEAESPFGWIAAMAGSAIASNVKNEAKLALYYFVSNRPDNGIATISKTWFVDSGEVDADGKKIFKPAYPPFSEDLSSDAAKDAFEKWQENMRDLQKKGLAYESGQRLNLGNAVVNISDTNKPEHIVNVKVGGKDYTILINGNPRAAQAINGDLNIESSSQDYGKVFGPMLRWMSSVNTSYNPEFWITNMQRDMLFTAMAVSAKGDAAYRRRFASNYMKAFKVISLVAKNEKGSLGNSYIENMYRDFVENGGVTGYTQIKDNETWEKEIARYMKSQNAEDKKMGNAMKMVKDGLHAFHRFGESLEQVSRFTAFLTSREMGKPMSEAVNDAKEITVNFNRKGSGKMISFEEAKHLTDGNGQPLNKVQQWLAVGVSSIAPLGRRFIMFFNAAIQGLNAMYKLYRNNPGKMAGWSIGYLALGVLNALMHSLMDDDDDYLDMPQYERRNSLLLGGNGVYFKWAMPQEARAFYAFGDLAVESVMGRNPHQNILGESLKIGTEILPVNPAEGWKAFLPSVAVPFVELALNEDYKGDPIFSDQKWLSEEEKKRTAKWSKAYQGTGKMYINIAKALNNVTGGDEYDAGLINIQPEKMEHLVQSAFGGTIRTVDKFVNSLMAAIDPEEDVTVRQFPFLNRILTLNDERFKNVHVNDVYDYYAAEADHVASLQKQYLKAGMADEYRQLMKSDEYKWSLIYSRYKKPVKLLQEQIRAAEGTAERKKLMKQQDELKRKMVKEISDL